MKELIDKYIGELRRLRDKQKHKTTHARSLVTSARIMTIKEVLNDMIEYKKKEDKRNKEMRDAFMSNNSYWKDKPVYNKEIEEE